MKPASTFLARALCLGLLAGAVTLGSGCATEGSRRSENSEVDPNEEARRAMGSDKFPIRAGEWAKFGYRWDWSGFPYVGRRQKLTRMVPLDDTVLVQESGSSVTALEASNGSQRWSSTLGDPLDRYVGLTRYSDPALGQVVLACAQSEFLFLSMQTGEILARQRPERVVNEGPLLLGDVAVFGSPVGEIVGHLLTRDVKLWGFQADAGVEQAPVLVNESTFAAVSQSGEVDFLSINGRLVARARCYAGPGAPLAAGNGLLFVPSLDQSLYCFNPQGVPVWRHRTSGPVRGKPVFHEGVLICDVPDTGLTAFDAGTGRVVWNNADVRGNVVCIRGGNFLVQDGSRVTLVDARRGDLIHQQTFPNLGLLVADSFVDGNLYAMAPAGVVSRFIPR